MPLGMPPLPPDENFKGNSNNPVPPVQDGPEVVIEVREIDFTDEKGVYTTQPSDVAVWTDYQIRNRYEKDHHKYMIGLTSPNGLRLHGNSRGQCVGFVQLAYPTLLWVCEWTACRYVTQPVIPDPYVFSDWILLDEYYEPFSLGLSPDGVTPLYRISGVYVFGHVCPDDVTVNNINFPRNPWMRDEFDRTMPNETLTDNLINVQSQPGGATGNLAGRKGQ